MAKQVTSGISRSLSTNRRAKSISGSALMHDLKNTVTSGTPQPTSVTEGGVTIVGTDGVVITYLAPGVVQVTLAPLRVFISEIIILTDEGQAGGEQLYYTYVDLTDYTEFYVQSNQRSGETAEYTIEYYNTLTPAWEPLDPTTPHLSTTGVAPGNEVWVGVNFDVTADARTEVALRLVTDVTVNDFNSSVTLLGYRAVEVTP